MSLLNPLNLYVRSKVGKHTLLGYVPSPNPSEKGILPEHVHMHTTWFILKLSQEAGDRPQLSKLFMQCIFWHSCRAHREQAAWMALRTATFNHHFSRAILSPSSVTLQVLKFRGYNTASFFCKQTLHIHNECNGNSHKSNWSQNKTLNQHSIWM